MERLGSIVDALFVKTGGKKAKAAKKITAEQCRDILNKYGVTYFDEKRDLAEKLIRAEQTLEVCAGCDGKVCSSEKRGMQPKIISGEGAAMVQFNLCPTKYPDPLTVCLKYAQQYGADKVEPLQLPEIELNQERLEICADCDGETCPWGGKLPYIKTETTPAGERVIKTGLFFTCPKNMNWLTDEEPGSAADLAKKSEYRALIAQTAEKYGVKEMTLSLAYNIRGQEKFMADCKRCRETGSVQSCLRKGKVPQIKIEGGRVILYQTDCAMYGEYTALKKLRAIGVPRKYWEKSFDDYVEDADNRKAIRWAKEYALKLPDKSLYFYGGVRTGKTFLVSLMIKEMIRQHLDNIPWIIFGDIPTLLDRIKETFDNPDQSAQSVLDRYSRVEYLFLDDLGTGKVNDWSTNILYQIINNRYNDNLPVVVTSNLSLEELEKVLSRADKTMAGRIVSRLEEMCVAADMGNENKYRKYKG